MACNTSSSRNVSIGITAAGLPANRRVVKASSWKMGIRIGNDLPSGLPLVRLCRGCAPFTTSGGLLDVLLAPDGEESRPAAPPSDAREKVMARLGPALAAGRRRR